MLLVGELFEVESTEKEARTKASSIQAQTESGNIKQVSLETLSQQIEEGNVKKLNLVIKSDVHGSIEAIISSIENIPSDEVSIQILHSATGPITENDVMLAKASEAVIIAFGLPEHSEIKAIATENNVSVKYYNIIYNIIDDIKKAAEGLFTVEYEEIEIGEAEVRDIFKFSKVGIIAGSYVLSGKIIRNSLIKVFRENEEVFNGKLSSLKRFKDDVKEVAAGYECGIVLDGFNELQENDLIKCLKLEEKKRTL